MLELDFEIPWGFFDGMCQGHPSSYGVGVVLYINHSHYIHIWYAPGVGTNNRAKFTTLWILLEAVIKKDVHKLQVLGDLKLVIDWTRNKVTLHNIRLRNSAGYKVVLSIL